MVREASDRDLRLDDGDIALPPPDDEPDFGGSGPHRPSGHGIWRWLLLLALGVAVERLSMLTLALSEAWAALTVAAVLFVTAPVVAGLVLATRFASARDADLGR